MARQLASAAPSRARPACPAGVSSGVHVRTDHQPCRVIRLAVLPMYCDAASERQRGAEHELRPADPPSRSRAALLPSSLANAPLSADALRGRWRGGPVALVLHGRVLNGGRPDPECRLGALPSWPTPGQPVLPARYALSRLLACFVPAARPRPYLTWGPSFWVRCSAFGARSGRLDGGHPPSSGLSPPSRVGSSASSPAPPAPLGPAYTSCRPRA